MTTGRIAVNKMTLLWNPYSTNNIYARNWKRGFIKPEPRKQKDSYILQARMQLTEKLEHKVKVTAELYFWDRRKRDIDNYNKLWMDALSWIAYDDDKQIVELHLSKSYDKDNPRIELFLEDAFVDIS